ncbi:MAG: GAF domain-containing protein [Pseudomonadota bacterium]
MNFSSSAGDVLASLGDVAGAYAETENPVIRVCAALEVFAAPTLRHVLCTVNRFDASSMEVVRLYSSNPVAYPPGGRKAKRGTPWGQQVLLDKRIYVGEGADAIRADFDDHDVIIRLGLQSVINVPVVFRGECLGTINLLMTEPTVPAEKIAFAGLLGLLVMPLLQARER